MARPKNKLERKLIEQQRLVRLYYQEAGWYPQHVKFLIKECPNYERDKYGYCKNCPCRCYKENNLLVTWTLPKQKFTAVKQHYRSGCTTFYKKHSNKCVRNTKEVYNHGSYKKVFDYAWTVD